MLHMWYCSQATFIEGKWCVACEKTVFPLTLVCGVTPTRHLFHVFCTSQLHLMQTGMIERKGKKTGGTKESLKTLTSQWLPGLTVLKQYYYYAACSLVKTTPPALVGVDEEKNWVRGERVSRKLPTKRRGARERAGCGLHTGTPARPLFIELVSPKF